MQSYKFKVTDNVFFNMFETNSHYDAMAHLEERAMDSNLVVTIKDMSTRTSKSYKWNSKEQCLTKY